MRHNRHNTALMYIVLTILSVFIVIVCITTEANVFVISILTVFMIAIAALIYYLPDITGKSVNLLLKSKFNPHDFGDITLDNVQISERGSGVVHPEQLKQPKD